ncbi:hypothetical protein [Paenibacillus sp. GYB003]
MDYFYGDPGKLTVGIAKMERGTHMHHIIGIAIGGGIAALMDLLQWLL